MRTSEQLKAHIRNRAKIANVQTEILLRSFMLERFLERIANSKYKHNFILKGGMLIASMVGIAERTTMDMDATIKGTNSTAKHRRKTRHNGTNDRDGHHYSHGSRQSSDERSVAALSVKI